MPAKSRDTTEQFPVLSIASNRRKVPRSRRHIFLAEHHFASALAECHETGFVFNSVEVNRRKRCLASDERSVNAGSVHIADDNKSFEQIIVDKKFSVVAVMACVDALARV